MNANRNKKKWHHKRLAAVTSALLLIFMVFGHNQNAMAFTVYSMIYPHGGVTSGNAFQIVINNFQLTLPTAEQLKSRGWEFKPGKKLMGYRAGSSETLLGNTVYAPGRLYSNFRLVAHFWCVWGDSLWYEVNYAKGNDNSGVSGDLPVDEKRYYYEDQGATDMTATVLSGGLLKAHSRLSWNTQPDGSGKEYKVGDKFEVTEDTTLYSRWTTIEHPSKVSYSLNGGRGTVPVDNRSYYADGINYAVTTKVPATDVKKDGYTFYAWNTEADGSGTEVAAGNKYYLINTPDAAKIRFYAQWGGSVKYHANGTGVIGDIPTSASKVHKLGEKIQIEQQGRMLRDGYVFTGWNTSPDGRGTIFVPGQEIAVKGNMNLYAQWRKADHYKITYHANIDPFEGIVPVDNTDYMGDGIHQTGWVKKNTLAADRKKFIEWNEMPDGSGKSHNPNTEIAVNSNIDLFAQWKDTEVWHITYDGNGGTGEVVDNENYYDDNLHNKATVKENGFIRENCSFIQWICGDKGYEEKQDIVVNGNMNLVAQWGGIITYHNNTLDPLAQEAPVDSRLHPVEEEARAAAAINREHYKFMGWSTEPDGGTVYPAEGGVMVHGNMDLYANWTIADEFHVTYHKNPPENAENPVQGILPVDGNTYFNDGLHNKITILGDGALSLEDYEFAGWNTEPDGSGEQYSPNDILALKASDTNTDIQLYAQWRKIIYITGPEQKTRPYDGTNKWQGGLGIEGLPPGLSLHIGDKTAEDKNAGEDKTLTFKDVYLEGAGAEKYVLKVKPGTGNYNEETKEFTGIGDITPLPISPDRLVNTDKTYDKSADFKGDIIFSGVLEGDSLQAKWQGGYDDKNAGTDKPIHLTDITLTGENANNYVLVTDDIEGVGDVNRKEISITDVTNTEKEYDGTNSWKGQVSADGIHKGDHVGIDISGGVFDKKDPGDRNVILEDVKLTGDDADNYVIAGLDKDGNYEVPGKIVNDVRFSDDNHGADGEKKPGEEVNTSGSNDSTPVDGNTGKDQNRFDSENRKNNVDAFMKYGGAVRISLEDRPLNLLKLAAEDESGSSISTSGRPQTGDAGLYGGYERTGEDNPDCIIHLIAILGLTSALQYILLRKWYKRKIGIKEIHPFFDQTLPLIGVPICVILWFIRGCSMDAGAILSWITVSVLGWLWLEERIFNKEMLNSQQ